jgi:hypothetical protein
VVLPGIALLLGIISQSRYRHGTVVMDLAYGVHQGPSKGWFTSIHIDNKPLAFPICPCSTVKGTNNYSTQTNNSHSPKSSSSPEPTERRHPITNKNPFMTRIYVLRKRKQLKRWSSERSSRLLLHVRVRALILQTAHKKKM